MASYYGVPANRLTATLIKQSLIIDDCTIREYQCVNVKVNERKNAKLAHHTMHEVCIQLVFARLMIIRDLGATC